MSDIKSSNQQDSGFGEDIIAPPPGPPPPSVPEGWLARWDDNYKQFYFVNLVTKKSQWEQPVEPAKGVDGPTPPSYEFDSESSRGRQTIDSRPQACAATSQPYVQQQPQSYLQTPDNDASRSRSRSGLKAKISKFLKSHSSAPVARPQYGTPPPTHYYGGMPPQNQYYQQQSMMAGNPYGMGTGYGPPARKKPGLGMAGGAGLGLGAGMLGGMLMADAVNDHNQDIYQEGYQDGMDNDFGGGDFDGGDFGGDF
ncbi:hypothetical protein K440DRAFT_645631 [Wilcoxina mikolae CBS 423.85]|nr:hypothetical protein K440DRAFT_645631 [Wilcoxina mikolae CBS 423.85]